MHFALCTLLVGFDASRAFTKERTGTENYSWQLLLALANLECEHRFRVYTKANSKFLRQLADQSSKLEEKIINWQYFWTQGGLALETWQSPVDLLFIPAHVIPFLKNPRVPTVVTVHDLGFEYLPWYQNSIQRFYLSKIVENLRTRLATHIIAVSQATKKDLIEKLRVPEGKITVVYEGIDKEKFKVHPPAGGSKFKVEEVKRNYKIEGEYILFVGTIQPRKNLVRLIEAFARLSGEIREEKSRALKEFSEPGSGESRISLANFQLILVGKRGWSAEEIYQAPKRFGVAEKVKFLDYADDNDLPALYAGALCFCLPSLHEGFGLPVLEAMACGTPVVISNTSSLPEVGGDAAVYVSPYDVNSIARGLGKVLSTHTTSYKQLVEKGLKQVQKFSWDKCAKETMKVFEKVVSGK